MEDPSAKDVSPAKKNEISWTILGMLDSNHNGVIEKEEFMAFCGQRRGGSKGVLPDFGTGPGHHWDMEMEYEIHHWEKYVLAFVLHCGKEGENKVNGTQVS